MAIDFTAILNTYRQLQTQANKANENRYQDILKTIGDTQATVAGRYSQVDQLLNSVGLAERERIDQSAIKATGQREEDLISRGLFNTTRALTDKQDIQDDRNRAQRELTESLSRQRADVLQNQAGADERMGNFLAQMMEAKTEKGPDMGLLTDLLTKAGAAEGQQAPITNTRVNTPSMSLKDSLGWGDTAPAIGGAGGAGGGPLGSSGIFGGGGGSVSGGGGPTTYYGGQNTGYNITPGVNAPSLFGGGATSSYADFASQALGNLGAPMDDGGRQYIDPATGRWVDGGMSQADYDAKKPAQPLSDEELNAAQQDQLAEETPANFAGAQNPGDDKSIFKAFTDKQGNRQTTTFGYFI